MIHIYYFLVIYLPKYTNLIEGPFTNIILQRLNIGHLQLGSQKWGTWQHWLAEHVASISEQ